MLSQIERWIEFAAAGVDLLLLLRILGLRLQRKYVFITLFCTLTLLFDSVALVLAKQSPEAERLSIYSTILQALVLPAAVWDVFEELEENLADIRRLAIWRAVTSVLLMAGFAVLSASMVATPDDPTGLAYIFIFSWILLLGSCTAAFAFLWSIHRILRKQDSALPHNTSVWLYYFELLVAGFLIDSLRVYSDQALAGVSKMIPEVETLVLNAYLIGIGVWCAVRLRSLPAADLPPAPVSQG